MSADHFAQAEMYLLLATEPEATYEKAVIFANVAQTHALLSQIEAAREVGGIQREAIAAMNAAIAVEVPKSHPSKPEVEPS